MPPPGRYRLVVIVAHKTVAHRTVAVRGRS
jgi:hypothetical protein